MKKALIIAITIASLVLIFSVGKAMTGMIIYDNNTKELCESNNDCSTNGDVCCLFNGEKAGVCDQQSRCDAISGVTKSKELRIERPARVESNGMIILAGTIFVLAVALALAITFYKIKHKIHVHKSKSKKTSFYKNIFPIKIKVESSKAGLYIVFIVVIVALVAIFIMLI